MRLVLRRWAINLAVAGGSVLLALVLLELAVRAIGPGGPAGEAQVSMQHDSLLGWRKVPNTTVRFTTAEYQIEERINRYGMRGPAHDPEERRGVRRLLLLGDSFVEGYTVGEDAVVSAVLERALQEQIPQRLQVLNAGTAGYSTDQELLYFRRDGRQWRPDLTILFFYVNDVWFNAQRRYWRGAKPVFRLGPAGLSLEGVPVPPPASDQFAFEVSGGTGVAWLVRRADALAGRTSHLYRLLRTTVRQAPWVSRWLFPTGLAAVPDEYRPWRTTPDPALDRAWAVTEELLAELDREVHAAGSDFVVFYVPPRPVVYAEDWTRTRQAYAMDERDWDVEADERRLRVACLTHAIECVFPTDAFQEAAGRAGRAERLYFRGDAHWTASGHRLAAELIAAYVASGDGP